MNKCSTVFTKHILIEFCKNIAPILDYDEKRIEMIQKTKRLDINDEDLLTGIIRIKKDEYRKAICNFSLFKGLLLSISELIPSKVDDDVSQRTGEKIKEHIDSLLPGLEKCITFFKEDQEAGGDYPPELKVFFSEFALVLPFYFQLYLFTYDLFYGPQEEKKDSETLISAIDKMFGMLSSYQQTVENIVDNTQETNKLVGELKKSSNENLNTLNKKTDQLLQEQKETQRKMIVQGARSSRENKKLEDKITKRNQKESRNELTQMDCARIMAEERKKNYEAKKSLLDALKMSTETIDKDKNPDEENIVRTIERWDTGETKPPVGYSRRISEYEFREWVKKREKRKLDNWIVKIRRSLKTVRAELVPEAVLDEWMRLNTGNDNDPYSKINA